GRGGRACLGLIEQPPRLAHRVVPGSPMSRSGTSYAVDGPLEFCLAKRHVMRAPHILERYRMRSGDCHTVSRLLVTKFRQVPDIVPIRHKQHCSANVSVAGWQSLTSLGLAVKGSYMAAQIVSAVSSSLKPAAIGKFASALALGATARQMAVAAP